MQNSGLSGSKLERERRKPAPAEIVSVMFEHDDAADSPLFEHLGMAKDHGRARKLSRKPKAAAP